MPFRNLIELPSYLTSSYDHPVCAVHSGNALTAFRLALAKRVLPMPSEESKDDKQLPDEKAVLTAEELEKLMNEKEATRMAEAFVKGLNEGVLKNHPTS